MTAGRPALEIVPHPEPTSDDVDTSAAGQDWRAQAVIDQYSPEHQLIGSLMWLSTQAAAPLLDLVPDTAIWRPDTRWAYELIRRVVDDGNTPTPPAVLAAGRHHPARDALDPAHEPTTTRHARLALYLFDAYSQAVAPQAAAATYARDVLDDAYRRSFETCGIRMQQLASCGADREDLTAQFATIRDELADLWRRAESATTPDTSLR
jgi:hypothetical protein